LLGCEYIIESIRESVLESMSGSIVHSSILPRSAAYRPPFAI
jgi:hypothetical protein